MGEQRNLTEENVSELREHLEKMKKDNPKLEYRFFPQDEKPEPDQPDTITIIKEIQEKLEMLERKIDLIFSDHFLKDGQWFRLGI